MKEMVFGEIFTDENLEDFFKNNYKDLDLKLREQTSIFCFDKETKQINKNMIVRLDNDIYSIYNKYGYDNFNRWLIYNDKLYELDCEECDGFKYLRGYYIETRKSISKYSTIVVRDVFHEGNDDIELKRQLYLEFKHKENKKLYYYKILYTADDEIYNDITEGKHVDFVNLENIQFDAFNDKMYKTIMNINHADLSNIQFSEFELLFTLAPLCSNENYKIFKKFPLKKIDIKNLVIVKTDTGEKIALNNNKKIQNAFDDNVRKTIQGICKSLSNHINPFIKPKNIIFEDHYHILNNQLMVFEKHGQGVYINWQNKNINTEVLKKYKLFKLLSENN